MEISFWFKIYDEDTDDFYPEVNESVEAETFEDACQYLNSEYGYVEIVSFSIEEE